LDQLAQGFGAALDELFDVEVTTTVPTAT